MQNQFVNEEQANALKLLGFDDLFFGVYVDGKFYRDYAIFRWSDFENVIKAPLKQQAIEWLLEKHHIYGWVEHYWYPLGHRWRACIKNINQSKSQCQGEFKSYDEALSYVIDWAIKKLKNES